MGNVDHISMLGTAVTNEVAFLSADSKGDDANVQAMADDLKIADGLFDGTTRKG